MTVCAQNRKGALVRKEISPIGNLFLEKNMEIDIEPFVARVWKDIKQKHLLEMLEDLESLKYVPVEIRRKAASEPMFIVRYE